MKYSMVAEVFEHGPKTARDPKVQERLNSLDSQIARLQEQRKELADSAVEIPIQPALARFAFAADVKTAHEAAEHLLGKLLEMLNKKHFTVQNLFVSRAPDEHFSSNFIPDPEVCAKVKANFLKHFKDQTHKHLPPLEMTEVKPMEG